MKKLITTIVLCSAILLASIAVTADASRTGRARTLTINTSDVATNPIVVNIGARARFSFTQDTGNPHLFSLKIVTSDGGVAVFPVDNFVKLRVSVAS